MKATMKTIIVLTLIFCESLTVRGQLDKSKLQIGVGAGAFVYQGDLTPEILGSYKTLKPSFSIYVNKIMTPLLSFRTQLAIGALSGDDSKYAKPAYRQQRNFKFQSPVIELSELLIADILRDNMSKQFFGLSPYLFSGIGFTFLNIHRDYSHFNTEYFASEASTLQGLAADAQHSLPKLIPVIPIGIGIKYPLSQKFMISAETSYRVTFTDYIDGFSRAANPSRRDSYQTHNIGIVYRFVSNNTMKCPVF
jgi:hypothetical protein